MICFGGKQLLVPASANTDLESAPAVLQLVVKVQRITGMRIATNHAACLVCDLCVLLLLLLNCPA